MFNKEFYPTPIHVLDMMAIDCNNKIVLEPSAGKGDIIDYLQSHRAKEVLAYEFNEDLNKIVSSKCNVLGRDFFECTSDKVSHINMIVMNPPFSNADKHIAHAFEIAPPGCEIIALCNYETISKDRRYSKLSGLVKNYGVADNLGDCFSTAERKTNVEVGLIRLFKPITSSSSDFEGFFMEEDEYIDNSHEDPSLMSYNEVTALVNRYVGAIKTFDQMSLIKESLEYSLKPIGVKEINFEIGYNNKITSREEFAKDLQVKSWAHIFNKMNMSKYVTAGVRDNINRFVQTQSKYPFTEKNVYKMFEIIVGTRQNTYNKALEEAVDNYTKHTHQNRFGVEGWKTNSGHMLNKKIIIEGMVQSWYGSISLTFGRQKDMLEDLVKVLCNITATNYDSVSTLSKFFSRKDLKTNTWYEWGFFEIKFFKKGTMHLKFIDNDVWYRLNKAYGELKGFTLSDNYSKN